MPGQGILAKLPPFQGEEVVLVNEQDIDDIVHGVLTRHNKYAWHYDLIADEFLGGDEYDISKRLFDFVKRSIPYEIESKDRQTVRSPAAILVMSDYWGGDCKHYASFIAGVLDAIGRITGDPINWVYRFAGYNILEPKNLGHVFVVVNPDPNDRDAGIWIDPVLDEFNTRYPWPWYSKDKRPKNSMSLVQVSGFPKSISNNVVTRRLTSSENATGGGGCVGDATAVTSALDEVEPGMGTAIGQAMSVLPEGDVKDFLQGLLSNPQKAIMQLITGRTYTSGDYKLGEYFMRNILGMSNVQRWEQVPDQYCPQAWAFFTTAMGVRVRTSDDLDALCGYASTRQARAANYLLRGQTADISQAAAERAAYLLGEPGFDGLFSVYKNRDIKWPMSVFNGLPFIYPIPGVLQDGPLFTGVHPVTGETFSNGYPASYTGPRYVSQKSTVLQSALTLPGGSTTPAATTPPAGTPGATNANVSVLDLAKANPITAVVIVGAGLYALSQGGLKPKKARYVRGIGKNKIVWYAGGAVALYFLLRKKPAVTTTTDPTATTNIPPPNPLYTNPGTIPLPTSGPGVTAPPAPSQPPASTPVYNIPTPTTGPGIVLNPNPVYDAPVDTVLEPILLNPSDVMYPPADNGGGGSGGGGDSIEQNPYSSLDYYAF
jgi:hypothetical protein